MKNYKKAIIYYKLVIDKDNENVDVLMKLGLIFQFQTKNKEKAKTVFSRILEIDPNNEKAKRALTKLLTN